MTLIYKNFIGEIKYNYYYKIYYGKILNINDLVIYNAATPKSLEDEFKKAINKYLN